MLCKKSSDLHVDADVISFQDLRLPPQVLPSMIVPVLCHNLFRVKVPVDGSSLPIFSLVSGYCSFVADWCLTSSHGWPGRNASFSLCPWEVPPLGPFWERFRWERHLPPWSRNPGLKRILHSRDKWPLMLHRYILSAPILIHRTVIEQAQLCWSTSARPF